MSSQLCVHDVSISGYQPDVFGKSSDDLNCLGFHDTGDYLNIKSSITKRTKTPTSSSGACAVIGERRGESEEQFDKN